MHPKVKSRPKGPGSPVTGVEPLMPHEATRQAASINEAPGRGMITDKSMPGTANHARHHAPMKAQS